MSLTDLAHVDDAALASGGRAIEDDVPNVPERQVTLSPAQAGGGGVRHETTVMVQMYDDRTLVFVSQTGSLGSLVRLSLSLPPAVQVQSKLTKVSAADSGLAASSRRTSSRVTDALRLFFFIPARGPQAPSQRARRPSPLELTRRRASLWCRAGRATLAGALHALRDSDRPTLLLQRARGWHERRASQACHLGHRAFPPRHTWEREHNRSWWRR